MTDSLKYDVFLSHSAKDKAAVRELAERLKADGLRVWLDEWEIKPGDMVGLKIKQGLEQSRTLVLVMSANASDSEWVTFESQTILFSDPTNQQRRFIPLRLDDAEIKGTLKQFAYVDWRQMSDSEYARLLAVCRTATEKLEVIIQDQSKKDQETIKSFAVLEQQLKGHNNSVESLCVSLDGNLIVTGSSDKTVKVWDFRTGECLTTLGEHKSPYIKSVAITPDGNYILSSDSLYGFIRVWDVQTGSNLKSFKDHSNEVWAVVALPDSQTALSASWDRTLKLWDIKSGRCLETIEVSDENVFCVAVTTNGRYAICGDRKGKLKFWDLETKQCLATMLGHAGIVHSVQITPDGRNAVSSSVDKTVKLWSLETGKCIGTYEGHGSSVKAVAVSPDGTLVASTGFIDQTLRVWDLNSGTCLQVIESDDSSFYTEVVTFSPDGSRLILGSGDSIYIYRLNWLQTLPPTETNQRYTNAKVLLVGDSGVGKSGLAVRLTEDRFEPTISTDAAWATQLNIPHDISSAEIEREIWLWDFAGQADYRLIHQLFMDETALAVLVFNPQSDNPFEGLGQWDRDLQRAARRPFKKLLVAGRCDRGGLMVSHNNIERFQNERGFTRYLETSAYTGKGCADLRDAIIRNIPWDDIPWTSSPRIFKLLKEEIVKLKDEGKALLRMGELKQQLEMRLPDETFTLEQLRAVAGLLAGPGIVWQLEFGDFVLLQPERINSYAAAVIRKVRAHTEEIGVIPEEDVLAGKLDYQDIKRLPLEEEQIVLRAMHQTLVDHGLCLREATEAGTLLVFPSYFKRERPELEDYPAILVTYQFNGQLDEIYSTLVVRLHHTPAFEKDQLWRFAADFRTPSGQRVGLKMTRQAEGAAEIAIYFGPGVSEDTQVTFIRYVHEHLQMKAQDVVRLRHYVCRHCNTPIENRRTVLDRLKRGLKDIICVNCEERVPLWDLIEQKFASEEFQQRVRELEEQARISIDNESKELILVGHAFAIAGEAGQIFRPTPNSDWGIDGEIEFKNHKGEASGKRVYLQLKSGDSYLQTRKDDGKEIFSIKNERQAEYWQAQAYPVMLVIRTSDGQIRWMNVTKHLQQQQKKTNRIIFDGEPFTAVSVVRLRDRLLS